MAQAPVLPRGFELPLEPRLPRIGSVDQVAVEERAATLAKRSIKREAKVYALDLAIRMMDLTTLAGADTPGKVAALASKAVRPDPTDRSIPAVAARVEARGGPGGRGAGRRRGRHGDRPRRLPRGAVREGLRRDRPREGGVR